MGMDSTRNLFQHRSKFAHVFYTLPERAGNRATPTPSPPFSHDCPFFSLCTKPSSSQRHCHNFSLSHHFLFRPTRRNTFSKSHRGKRPAGFKLSTKSKLYVHDMSEAVLTALSVCSASAKPIVVYVSFSPLLPLFLLPREKLCFYPL